MPQIYKTTFFLFSLLLLVALDSSTKSDSFVSKAEAKTIHIQQISIKPTLSQHDESELTSKSEVLKSDEIMQIEEARFVLVNTELELKPVKAALPLILTKILANKLLPHIAAIPINNTAKNKALDSESQIPQYIYFNKKTQLNDNPELFTAEIVTAKEEKQKLVSGIEHIGYWQTVHSIESKQGKLLYRPRNKSRSCTYTTSPCGHHQLTAQALKDIGCKSLQCRKDRLDYNKSLKLSKKLLALNEKRLRKNGLTNLEGYQKYLIHQQGATGIRHIIAATKGNKTLSKKTKKNMANNSPYSYSQLKRLSSKAAARKFMLHWKSKWVKEKRLIAGINAESTENLENELFIPTFSDNEITLALNYKF